MKDSDNWNSGLSATPVNHGVDANLVLQNLVQEALLENRRSRRWRIFFRFVTLLFLALFLLGLFGSQLQQFTGMSNGRHTAVVAVEGMIGSSESASAENIVASLVSALRNRDSAGVILRINSPGGSPVQSGIVFDEILRLRNAYPDKPIHAVIADISASGGYYIAAAADNIYANQASIVGSIGVSMDSFGLQGALEKIGVERRLMTAGENKGILDPFSPVDPDQKAHLQSILDTIHQQFITAVQRGRGQRLAEDPALFSGLIWSGEQAIDNGLVDKLANEDFVAREVIGASTLVDYTREEMLLDRVMGKVSVLQRLFTSGLDAGPRLQ